MTKDQIAQAWRTALDPAGEWVSRVLAAADERLTEVRHGDAQRRRAARSSLGSGPAAARRCPGSLSADHRAVIRRSYYLGWTTAQITADLQIAEGTVKSRLHYAVRALRLTLQEMGVTR